MKTSGVSFEGGREARGAGGNHRGDAAADVGVRADGLLVEPARAANERADCAGSLLLDEDLERAACAELELRRRVEAAVTRALGAEDAEDEGEAVVLVARDLLGPRDRAVLRRDRGPVGVRALGEPAFDGRAGMNDRGVGLVVSVLEYPVKLVGGNVEDLRRVERLRRCSPEPECGAGGRAESSSSVARPRTRRTQGPAGSWPERGRRRTSGASEHCRYDFHSSWGAS